MVKQKRNKKGFTLVELVIVLAILAILTAIAIPTVSNITESANVSVDKSNAQSVEMALKAAYSEAKTGVWELSTGKKLEDISVKEAMIHEGFKDGLPTLKVKDAKYCYKDGKIIASKNGSGGTVFDDTSNLADVIA
ncbi:type II secretion system protein [Caproiciproducens galactitolivorans]|uniref:Type II secretion system protein n=1 Tax=Caproiciproducens galactitolivorans TaxID=642589 RepID=A0ABT4BU41_9FIRM|nr:type II secretion system protein [Caproiciproducens galactitolivorans]MCY1714424.1 type II secretion system protein [Caproiciproducens galactitolivorans]